MKFGQLLGFGESIRQKLVDELVASPIDEAKLRTSYIIGGSIGVSIKTPKADLTESEFKWLQEFAEKLEANKTGSTTVKSEFNVMTCQGFPAIEIDVKARNLEDVCATLNGVLSPENQIDTSPISASISSRA